MQPPAHGDPRPLIVHVVYRFDVGGLENGVVNLINRLPDDAYRHAVLSLTDVTAFRDRITRRDVQFIEMHKPPGHAFRLYPRLFRLFRELRPALVHTRNLAALEVTLPAWLAGVPVRIHGEHGRDVGDLDGRNRRFQLLRRLYRPFVSHYVALSQDLARYLQEHVGIGAARLSQIYNGVDIEHFDALRAGRSIEGCPFNGQSTWLIGTVGRMQVVKHQTLLARAFVRALELAPGLRDRLRLAMIGDGPLRADCQAIVDAAGLGDLAWLPGQRSDVADVMRGLDCFVLPSLAEGISNTILEAMASGLPVIATDVGGNSDLVVHGQTGEIVPVDDIESLARAVVRLASAPADAAAMGAAGRARVAKRFSLQTMVAAYQHVYDRELASAGLDRRRR